MASGFIVPEVYCCLSSSRLEGCAMTLSPVQDAFIVSTRLVVPLSS